MAKAQQKPKKKASAKLEVVLSVIERLKSIFGLIGKMRFGQNQRKTTKHGAPPNKKTRSQHPLDKEELNTLFQNFSQFLNRLDQSSLFISQKKLLSRDQSNSERTDFLQKRVSEDSESIFEFQKKSGNVKKSKKNPKNEAPISKLIHGSPSPSFQNGQWTPNGPGDSQDFSSALQNPRHLGCFDPNEYRLGSQKRQSKEERSSLSPNPIKTGLALGVPTSKNSTQNLQNDNLNHFSLLNALLKAKTTPSESDSFSGIPATNSAISSLLNQFKMTLTPNKYIQGKNFFKQNPSLNTSQIESIVTLYPPSISDHLFNNKLFQSSSFDPLGPILYWLEA